MPRLHLVPEDDLHSTGILAMIEQRFQDLIDGYHRLGAEWANIVHCTLVRVRLRRLLRRDETNVQKNSSVFGAVADPATTRGAREGWRAMLVNRRSETAVLVDERGQLIREEERRGAGGRRRT